MSASTRVARLGEVKPGQQVEYCRANGRVTLRGRVGTRWHGRVRVDVAAQRLSGWRLPACQVLLPPEVQVRLLGEGNR